MNATPEHLLDDVVTRLKKEFQPDEIYLFGSHAWGTPRDNSDFDLMVIVPQSDERPVRRMQRAHRCLRYKDVKSSLQHAIVSCGRKLYG